MKYGVVTYHRRPMRKGSNNTLNLGDPIQTYAMKNLLNSMGVPDEEIVNVSRYHAAEYDEDYVLLPYNCFNMIGNQPNHEYNTLPLSSKIIPVFISFHLHSRDINDKIIENLKAYQPIGCRDEETMLNLRKHGIIAYLSGCVTALLPKRTKNPEKQKVFFVDVPNSLFEYIPESIRENAEFITHQPSFKRDTEEDYLTNDEYLKFYETSIKLLNRYRDEATLVVTSRLHAASPCMAMGIPVILVGNNFDDRYSWIDKYLKLYTPNNFNEINWNPEPVHYEKDKDMLRGVFTNQIKKAYHENKDIYGISSYYEKRNRFDYNSGVLRLLKELDKEQNSSKKYAIWGATDKALNVKNVICDYFPNWNLVTVIDENVTGEFEGIEVKRSIEIDSMDNDIMYIVIPKAAHNYAADFLKRRDKKYILIDL